MATLDQLSDYPGSLRLERTSAFRSEDGVDLDSLIVLPENFAVHVPTFLVGIRSDHRHLFDARAEVHHFPLCWPIPRRECKYRHVLPTSDAGLFLVLTVPALRHDLQGIGAGRTQLPILANLCIVQTLDVFGASEPLKISTHFFCSELRLLRDAEDRPVSPGRAGRQSQRFENAPLVVGEVNAVHGRSVALSCPMGRNRISTI